MYMTFWKFCYILFCYIQWTRINLILGIFLFYFSVILRALQKFSEVLYDKFLVGESFQFQVSELIIYCYFESTILLLAGTYVTQMQCSWVASLRGAPKFQI